MRMTPRDKKVYQFLCQTKMPMSTSAIAKMFYLQNNTMTSALVIANRRLNKMVEDGYIDRLNRKFGEKAIYYCGKQPNKQQLRHKLIMTDFIAELVANQFKVIDCRFEYALPDKYGIRSDMFITIEYNNKLYYLFVEVDVTKEFNEKYLELIQDIEKGLFRTKYPVFIISISDFKINNETIRKSVVQIDTELSNFNKILWKFVK